MVSHQHPSVNYPAYLFTRFSKAFQKKSTILIIHKYRRTTIPSRHHMVKCPLKFQSNTSCHAVCLITPNKIPQHKNEMKCTLTPISPVSISGLRPISFGKVHEPGLWHENLRPKVARSLFSLAAAELRRYGRANNKSKGTGGKTRW